MSSLYIINNAKPSHKCNINKSIYISKYSRSALQSNNTRNKPSRQASASGHLGEASEARLGIEIYVRPVAAILAYTMITTPECLPIPVERTLIGKLVHHRDNCIAASATILLPPSSRMMLSCDVFL